MAIEHLKPAELMPFARNARTHSKKQIGQIASSIRTFGFINPIIIDKENMILAGHGRVEAAKLLAMGRIPCVRIETMTPSQKRAYVLADNKLALNAGWDEEILALELKGLLEVDETFDVGITGFSIAEVDGLIEGLAVEDAPAPREDKLPEPATEPPLTRPGDIWRLGPHRLICGNALSGEVIDTLMAGESADMVFTDPPYNVPIDGHVSGLGSVRHREFAMAAGEMSPEAFATFLEQALGNAARHSRDGSIHFICMDWRHLQEMLQAGGKAYGELKNLIVWVKDNGGMGTFYRSRHELVFVFKNGSAPHTNSFELGQHGRYRTNVWTYKGMNSFGAERKNALELHPTVKPVALVADAIKDVSSRNGIVLDLFGGSGSTLIAAHKTGRRGYLCEIDPLYCDSIIRRWQVYARDDAVREGDGETFDALRLLSEVNGQNATVEAPAKRKNTRAKN
ncbi:MAG: ParB N-terminal domain-containing protein [Rhizobiales bacterium]|nr:ParB N-terminal domain-containing protein [Hyphomicrobiales bacterium]